MVRADQGIRRRAPPPSKTRSTLSSTTTPTAPTPTRAGQGQQISKAAKRALKRAELVAHARTAAGNPPQTSTPSEAGQGQQQQQLSKSSLKRLKKKQRNNLAGNREGLRDLQDVMSDMQQQMSAAPSAPAQQKDEGDQMMDEEEEEEGEEERVDEPQSQQRKNNTGGGGVGASTAKDAVVTEKAKKRALAHEMARQPHILRDPAYASNPFAALRLHAQNTLAFDHVAGSRKKTAATAMGAGAGTR